MFRPWAFLRRVQYGVGFCTVLGLLSTGIYYLFFFVPPSCFDNMQNGTERAVDCGGACVRICRFDIVEPTVLWAKSFKVVEGQYNAVAYIENRNLAAGTPEVLYTMTLYDEQGVITERKGKAVLPPDSIYPVFEGRVLTGTRIPTRTTLTLEGGDVWLPAETGREQFELIKRDLTGADTKPRLTAQMRNTTLDEAKDVELVATIFDISGNPLTASRTTVDYFGGRSTQDVVFTWPEPIAKTLRSCEIPTDVVLAIDLSGSMDDDGGTPPEPVSSTLKAATSFVNRLKKHDQVSVVTYATEAQPAEALTSESARIAQYITDLTIAPKEQRGSTNVGDAIKRMTDEIGSDRHNPDARKVAVLLTDGLANMPEENPEQYALDAATVLKDMEVTLFTIGLGAKVNAEFLKQVASSPSLYYNAPSASEIDNIYRLITKAICEDGAAKIDIIPKAETSFTPLK